MDQRIEVGFAFGDKYYTANVLIKENEEGYNYIVNLFDKELNDTYPYSYTFIGKDGRFIPAKPTTDDNLQLINAIKEAIRRHPDNPYHFID